MEEFGACKIIKEEKTAENGEEETQAEEKTINYPLCEKKKQVTESRHCECSVGVRSIESRSRFLIFNHKFQFPSNRTNVGSFYTASVERRYILLANTHFQITFKLLII